MRYVDIEFGERLIDAIPVGLSKVKSAVAQLHADRAAHLSGTGTTAALALLYVRRAEALGLSAPTVTALRSSAEASFSASERVSLNVNIWTNPADDPVFQDIARRAVSNAIKGKARPFIRLTVSEATKAKGGDIGLALESIAVLTASMADLHRQTSTYLSHYEEVPNPLKAVLSSQLSFQRISVDSALSSYNSAVTYFNISPSNYGLMSVNNARITYNLAVNNFNSLVSQYNSTPATVSRAVYLPYVFREGTVHHGWRVSGTIDVMGTKEAFSVEEVDSDFVRLGSKPSDQNVSYRRDDRLDINVGVERLIDQLKKVADRISDRVASASRVTIQAATELDQRERDLLSTVLRPFEITGPTIQVAWAADAMRGLSLPITATGRPAQIRLVKSKTAARGGTPEQLAAYYTPAVAIVLGKRGELGSAALISGDGLLLTAAHVLRSEVEVVFPEDPSKRRYRTEVVFVNEARDVALLRAVGYRSSTWFEVALSESARSGEAVVAIGNPSIDGVGTVVSAISRGIIAKSYEASPGGLDVIVADVAVASGSSGGPLISATTGKLLGVVTSVVSPKISQDFATSGYWAIAAPSSELKEWLGLDYGE